MFLKPEDLKKSEGEQPIKPSGQHRARLNGTVMIYVSLGSFKEPLTYVYYYYYYCYYYSS
jgi:hypothetical protein